MSFWQTALSEGTTHPQMAQSIATGAEYRANLVGSIFARFLRRAPTAGELSFWVGAMNTGTTDEEVIAAIVGSAEYFSLAGATNPQFIAAAYQDLLGRPPTPTETSFWNAQLSGSTTRTQMAQSLATNTEYRQRLIGGLYTKLLHRSPSSVELSKGVQALETTTDEAVIAAIVGSVEYSTRNPGWTAAIDWGDGTTSSGAIAGNTVSGSHTYDHSGSFPIVVTLSDDRGVSATASGTAEVAEPPNSFGFGKPRRSKSKGTAVLPVSVPGPGTLRLSGRHVVTQTASTKGGTVNLLVKARGKTKRLLDRNGHTKVAVTVTYTPTAGTPNDASRSIGLREKRG